MAGGLGQRLHPLTDKLPKPLLKVGTKPILEQIIESYAGQGLKDFTLCLGYRAELIQAYFGSGKKLGVNIDYVVETEPLGTAGALRMIERPEEPFIVCNADVLTRLDAKALLKFHDYKACMATMVVGLYQHQVNYGVADFDENSMVIRIREKPIENLAVSIGVNVLNPSALDLIPDAGPYDMPDLLEALPGVAAYQHKEHWSDLGSFADLSRELIRGMMGQTA